jgi:hypothetical protein
MICLEEYIFFSIGFNSFENPARDTFTAQIKSKIGDGVMLRMDSSGRPDIQCQTSVVRAGNIVAVARGLAPVHVQGWQRTRSHCMPDRLIKQHGRLVTADPGGKVDERERQIKVFDMKIFKCALTSAVAADYLDSDARREMLARTCIRELIRFDLTCSVQACRW